MSDSETPKSPETFRTTALEHVETPGKEHLIDPLSVAGSKTEDHSPSEKVKPAEEASEQIKSAIATSAPSMAPPGTTGKLSLSGIKIKKRTITSTTETDSSSQVTTQAKGFSRRGAREQHATVTSSASAASVKPSWMKEENFKKVAPSASSNGDGPPRKLKRPSRRGDVEVQSRYARAEREKEDSEEQRIEEEIRMKARNLDTTVVQHYNKRTFQAKKERRNLSPIIKLRNFNNVIKHILINTYAKRGERVLDLGCGKGGDLRKWESAGIAQYVGIDISNESIKEAVRRYRSSNPRFEVTFVTGDAFGTPLPIVLSDFPFVQFPMDLVTMQFCLHYAFETEQKARMTIENVAKSLRPGGHFIGTIPNSEFIAHKIKHMPPGSKTFGNSIYAVTFDQEPPRSGEFAQPYGNLYDYYLKDAIDHVPEYIIQFEDLRALCDEFGLRMVYKKSFAEFFREKIPEWYSKLSPNVVEGIKRSDGQVGVQGEESEAAAQFYVAFAFMKAG